jgi:hypothetical protein
MRQPSIIYINKDGYDIWIAFNLEYCICRINFVKKRITPFLQSLWFVIALALLTPKHSPFTHSVEVLVRNFQYSVFDIAYLSETSTAACYFYLDRGCSTFPQLNSSILKQCKPCYINMNQSSCSQQRNTKTKFPRAESNYQNIITWFEQWRQSPILCVY